ncbi:MAG: response regulator [Candidatus Aminicenantes bacterium]|nr:response regulator [Candidatus Aminicenantes bacterium]NIM81230.1 response regulator [Candidatus Aminicenantes bacterium]NIN20605.1 response regulator [Candidatus Aminicenantes bacterium]NIN44384.1 response regulator [Candidatus Aminicenantes bacterium]NIN87203.1 response regulator [Candidatus Aminicenantes bacterium]
MKTELFLTVFLLGFVLISLSPFAFSLDPKKEITQYMLDSWGIEDGLPQNTVETIIQTRDGYLWIGTQEGLARFDGVRFKVYNKRDVEQFSNNWVRALYEDSEGTLWIGTNGGGLVRLKNGTFTAYTTANGLSNDLVLSIYQDREKNLWVGTEKGLNRMKEGRIITHTTKQGLSNYIIRAIHEDRKGGLWIGSHGGGLYHLEKGRFTIYTKAQGLSNDQVNAIYEDRQGNLWIGTNGGGLYSMKNGTPPFYAYTTKDGLASNVIRAIHEDRDGNLWIATHGGGVSRFKEGKFSSLAKKHGLSDNIVVSLCEDAEGSLWLGTWGGGLNCLKNGKFTLYTTKGGLSNDMVLCIYEDRKGYIWLATDGGLNRLDLRTGKFTVYTKKQGIASDLVVSIYEDRQGTMWIGTDGGGLNRMEKGKFSVYTTGDGLSNNMIRPICEDREGNLWIGTYGGGLNRLKNGKFTVYTTEHGLANNIIRAVYEDRKGNLWIGTEGGLNRMVRPDGRDAPLSFTTYTTKDGLAGNGVRAIYEDREGNLWIGTYSGGLSRLKNGKFTSITTNEGLFDDTVYQILEDDNGNLWMGCNKGVFQASRQELNRFCSGELEKVHCIAYDDNDGMKSRECNGISWPSAWKSSDGKLWFPTKKGAVRIDPGNIEINQLQPPLKIEAITVDDMEYQLPFAVKGGTLAFPPGTERFEIRYTGLSFLAPKKVRFKYKLEGFDRQWLKVDTRRTAFYTRLPPGNYTFRVKACNNDGIWNETGASISFYQRPYFFQTWWFYVMCGFVVLVLAGGLYSLRVKQLTNRKKELEHLVAERTHELEKTNKELEKLSIVASETDNAVVIMDARGNIEWLNEGFTRLYGYTLEQLIKEKGDNIVKGSTNPNIREIIAKIPIERKPVTYECIFTSRGGKKIWAQTTLTPIFDGQGHLIKMIAIDSDISKIKESEMQIKNQHQEILKKSQRLQEAIEIARKEREAANAANQAKSEFLARMSHEIRTPLNGIIGFSDMLMDTNLNDEQLDYARTIRHSGDALTALLNDILDFSKIEAGELTIMPIDFDPEVTVFDVFEIVVPRVANKPVEVMCWISDDVPAYVKGDAGRFRQVLANLMGNAVKFTMEGEIELSLDVDDEENERVKFHVKVRDTGIGIPEDKRESIFDAFQQADGSTTREYEGSGLGLSISRQIAALMGGDVWVESTPGKGSTFHFTAWMDKSEKQPVKEVAPGQELMEGKKALVVDDNRTNLEILTHVLKRAKMQVVALTQPDKVIPVLSESFASGDPVDICIIDIQMPETSGYDVARQIRQLDLPMSDLPLLAFSSSSLSRSGKYKEAGFDGFLPKPIQSKKLLRMIARLLVKPVDAKVEHREHKREAIVTQHSINEEVKHSVHILLAEDNPVNRKLASFMLTKAGYQLSVVENGEDAVKAYTSQPDTFDLIFMDIQMPRMNGFEATRIIREKEKQAGGKNGHIPIIAMTAQSMKGDREKCLDAGMDDYIAKPIKREVVFGMVKKWCLDRK